MKHGWAIVGLLVSSSAWAQEPAPPVRSGQQDVPPEEVPAGEGEAGASEGEGRRGPPAFIVSVEPTGGSSLPSDFEDGPGELREASAGVEAKLVIPFSAGAGLTFGVGGRTGWYDFRDAFELDPVGGDPFDVIHGTQVELGVRFSFAERWTAFVQVNAGSSFEEGAAFEDGVTFGGVGAVAYQLTENVSLGLGILGRSQLEDDPLVFPIPVIDVRFDLREDFWVRFALPQGLQVAYEPTESWRVSLIGLGFGRGAGVGTADTRLDDRGFAPEGVYREQRIPVTLLTEFEPAPFFKLTVGLGAYVYQSLQIDDRDGDRLVDARVGPTGFLSVGVRVRF